MAGALARNQPAISDFPSLRADREHWATELDNMGESMGHIGRHWESLTDLASMGGWYVRRGCETEAMPYETTRALAATVWVKQPGREGW